MKGKKDLIFYPMQRPALGELKKHNKEVGKRFVFFDKNNYPEGNIYIIAREMINIDNPYVPAEPRSHSVDAIMIFMGLGEDLDGLEAEVQLSNEKTIIKSPASVFIPKETLNSYKIIKGSGIYMKIVFAPLGDYNSVTK